MKKITGIYIALIAIVNIAIFLNADVLGANQFDPIIIGLIAINMLLDAEDGAPNIKRKLVFVSLIIILEVYILLKAIL